MKDKMIYLGNLWEKKTFDSPKLTLYFINFLQIFYEHKKMEKIYFLIRYTNRICLTNNEKSDYNILLVLISLKIKWNNYRCKIIEFPVQNLKLNFAKLFRFRTSCESVEPQKTEQSEATRSYFVSSNY